MRSYIEKLTSLDHMTHIDNLKSILENGLYAHNNSLKKVDISNQTVNARREVRENIYGRKIHDYVPFYFNPRNAMMYKNRNEDIVILAFSKKLLHKENVLFTNKNAAVSSVKFYKNYEDLSKINWSLLQSTSWFLKPEEVKQTMMAEVLVYDHVSIDNLIGVYCKDEKMKKLLVDKYDLESNKIRVNPTLFFK